ncbi:MAG: nucleoside kinase [Deltaproteobacteria bacterium]|nr:nucleoside kinase [Deltaproteobacteria bacterium]
MKTEDTLATIKFNNKKLKIKRGTKVKDLIAQYLLEESDDIIAVVLNNRTVSLDAEILRSGVIEPVYLCSRKGARLYQKHINIMLYEIFYSLYPHANIRIGQAISEGHYFKVTGITVDNKFIKTVTKSLHTLAESKTPFEFIRIPVEDARRRFYKMDRKDKKQLLDQWPQSHVPLIKLNNFIDFCLHPVAPHTGMFKYFNIIPLENDAFILQFPHHGTKDIPDSTFNQPKLYETHKMARKWSKIVKIQHVADLNKAAISKDIKEVIKISEALHEKKLSNIADKIAEAPVKRLVFISGPSSSGKTTFSKKLSIQLRVLGFQPIPLSLDNYYVDREKTPRGPDGKKDFELLEAIDLKQFNSDLRDILDGKEVLTPVYNFNTGLREEPSKGIPVLLGENGILIIEGIHGLNDALTPRIRNDEKFKIYINALNPLSIDNHNRLNTSDVRLLRRIVRDRHYRGYSAAQTINNWGSVRRGERTNIFRFQESADVIFDTSLIYEFSVLKIWADYYLMEVPRSDPAYAEAYRLKQFLSMFVAVLPADVPNTSIMREFIGGSSFSYR